MPDIKWIKITTEMFDDEKIRIIEAMPEADTLIVLWIRLVCMAGKVNAGGHIFLSPDLPYDDEQLAAVFNRPLNTVRLALTTFHRLQMIEMSEDGSIFLPNFERHQNIEGMERVRENTRKRVEAHRKREKVKLLRIKEDVTLPNVTVTQQNRIEKNRKREDENLNYLNTWNKILLRLKETMNEMNFETYLGDTICFEVNETEIIVGVRREDQATQLETNHRGLIEREIAYVTGAPLALKLVLIDHVDS